MAQWKPLPIYAKVSKNVDEAALRGGSVARLENAYITDEGTISRFPRLNEFIRFPGMGKVFLGTYKDMTIASVGGRTYRIDVENASYTDVTGALLNGAGRTIFFPTPSELLMAAGGKIISLAGNTTKILSSDAPECTHVGWLGGYAVAFEKGSNRWNYSESGAITSWPALNILSAEGNPDNINALLVSEFGDELLIAGPKTIEQFDLQSSGDRPFFRRWGLPTGLLAPYTLLSVDNRVWGINQKKEFIAYSAQIGKTESRDVQKVLSAVDDWKDAWSTEMAILGQRFILIQIPYATNEYGTPGITFLFDYRNRRWYQLFGWDSPTSSPARWPGWSYLQANERDFVGGEGVIYELAGNEGSDIQRMLWRSGHLDAQGSPDLRINKLRMRLKRGAAAAGQPAPVISLRVNKNNLGFGRKIRRTLGEIGQRDMMQQFEGMGIARSWQFEIEITDAAPVELIRVDVLVEALG